MADELDPDDLIGAAEVQAILRLSHPSSVTTYYRRYPDFPRPLVDLSSSRVRLWKRQEIEEWQQNREARSMIRDEIVPGDRSGGTNTSHTIIVAALVQLLGSVDRNADSAAYERAVLEQNVLGKDTTGSRRRTLRYLRELYLLRPDSILFRALRDLWSDDVAGQSLLAGLCALARDSVFRASATAIFETNPGDEVGSGDLAMAVEEVFPSAYSESTLAKIGRNTSSSWEQTGHLRSRCEKREGPGRARHALRPPSPMPSSWDTWRACGAQRFSTRPGHKPWTNLSLTWLSSRRWHRSAR